MNIRNHKLKRYLGDGVYASHDGYQVWLSINDRGGQDFETSIAVEPTVLDALKDYCGAVNRIKVETFNDLPEQI